jgi:hypothetical protein
MQEMLHSLLSRVWKMLPRMKSPSMHASMDCHLRRVPGLPGWRTDPWLPAALLFRRDYDC